MWSLIVEYHTLPSVVYSFKKKEEAVCSSHNIRKAIMKNKSEVLLTQGYTASLNNLKTWRVEKNDNEL